MKESGILFTAPMVRAILSGTKTQTRRVVKLPHQNPLGVWEPIVIGGEGVFQDKAMTIPAPKQAGIWHTRTGDCISYGSHDGERLWVREAWRTVVEADALPPRDLAPAHRIWYEADVPHQPGSGRFRPGIFMPRWASRITLEITDVRVERLQDINEADAAAEGLIKLRASGRYVVEKGEQYAGLADISARAVYRRLWEQINGPGSWDANPYVWVISFKKL